VNASGAIWVLFFDTEIAVGLYIMLVSIPFTDVFWKHLCQAQRSRR
jgi:hypothetical protein